MKIAWSKKPIMEVCHHFSKARRDVIDKLQMKSWLEGAYVLSQSLESLAVLLKRTAEEVLGTSSVKVEVDFRSSTPVPEVGEYLEPPSSPMEAKDIAIMKKEPLEGNVGPSTPACDDGEYIEPPPSPMEAKDVVTMEEEPRGNWSRARAE